MELVCIVCPNGCRLTVTQTGEEIAVDGARCKRGVAFAQAETTCPMRTVTSSVKTTVKGFPVVSVKTDGEIEKAKIFPLMKLLSEVTLTKAVPIGTVVLKNIFDTKVNVVTTTQMEGKDE